MGIRMDLREIGWGSVDWIHLAQDRDRWQAFVNTVMKVWVLAPQNELGTVDMSSMYVVLNTLFYSIVWTDLHVWSRKVY
jgi:hypothetical protein